MTHLLSEAGRSFLRAFAVTFVAFATGILGATNESSAVALSIAALAASVAAGLKAIQVFVPQISFDAILPAPWSTYADSFVRAFVGAFLVTVTGWLAAPNWSVWHSALLGALVGAATAGIRAIQGLLTIGEEPSTDKGIKIPAKTKGATT